MISTYAFVKIEQDRNRFFCPPRWQFLMQKLNRRALAFLKMEQMETVTPKKVNF